MIVLLNIQHKSDLSWESLVINATVKHLKFANVNDFKVLYFLEDRKFISFSIDQTVKVKEKHFLHWGLFKNAAALIFITSDKFTACNNDTAFHY